MTLDLVLGASDLVVTLGQELDLSISDLRLPFNTQHIKNTLSFLTKAFKTASLSIPADSLIC